MSTVVLATIDGGGQLVWRVGRAPDPWAWIEPQYAGNNRWDDAGGVFRTIYVADSLYACFVEVLAYARPDLEPDGSDLLSQIEEDAADADEYPVPPAGALPREWISGRMVTSATISGMFVDVRSAGTIAALRPIFLRLAQSLGYPDFDAAALKSAHPRALTQRVATYLYALTGEDASPLVDGIRFASRHGDDLTMWAVFERPEDDPSSHRFEQDSSALVRDEDDDLTRAMELHGLFWA